MPNLNPALLFLQPLERLELPYMVVGAYAAIAYGVVRDTRDVDIVLTLDVEDIGKVTGAFPLQDFYCPYPETLVEEVLRPRNGQFNVIHHATGYKADFYPAGRDALNQWAFHHRRRFPMDGVPVWFAPPELVIINKLEYYREGGSDKHPRDIRIMLALTAVDYPFLEAEIARRGLQKEWLQCRSIAR